jgi:DNA helicase-2/ATP-dependent DNA helicase PcrA
MVDERNLRHRLAGLNPEQHAAVTHASGPLLVLAGAGTGKTSTLCARMAWLVSRGVPVERMLLLTFTRRAAREMIQRASALAERGGGARARVVGGTFHSVAHGMVRLHASSLGLGPGFGLMDAGDATDLMELVRLDHGHGKQPRRFPRARTMLDVYSRTVNAQAPLAEVLAGTFPWCAAHQPALADCFRAYNARKRTLGVLDLDDLLLYWRALATDEVIGSKLDESFDHILVDEYQDVNGLQVDIIRALRRRRRGITVVGDDFQAIYGFRAASAQHILDFARHFPDTATVTLQRNYRSTEPILAVANAVSAQDRLGFPKQLRAQRKGGRRPELVFPRDEMQQAAEVCERVLEAREEGLELRSQAVLFRTGHDSDLLELELTRRDIPFVKYGGLRYLDAAHVKDLVALLRVADNPSDEVSWFRLLRLVDGIGPARARRTLDALRPSPERPPELARWREAIAELPEDAVDQAGDVLKALAADASEARSRRGVGVRVKHLCEALEPLIRLRYHDWTARLADFDQVASAADGAPDMRHFVSELVLDPPASSCDLAGSPHLDEDYLVLSTVHSAKGLEWEAVHLISAYDGNFPADMSAGTEEQVAEERRLLYVALTRARRTLHVYVPLRYYHRKQGRDDAHGYGRASRFLSDRVQALFKLTRTEGLPAMPLSGADSPPRRIEVSVEALLG